MPITDSLSATLAAVADPTRRAILARLREGEASVNELAAPFAMSLPAISKHIKVLERAGLLERGRNAQFRPCRLRAEGLRPAADWLETYRELWQQRLDRMEAYLAELQRNAPAPQRAKAPRRARTSTTSRNRSRPDRRP